MNKASFTNLILLLFLRIGRFLKNIFSPISFLAKVYIKQTGQLISGNKNTGICLDVGAGIAPYEKNIKKHFGVSSYIPIDVAPSNSTMVVTNACCLPFKNSTFNMASVDTLEEKRQANKLGYRTFRTRLASEPIEPDEVVCLSDKVAREGKTLVPCSLCKMCSGNNSQVKKNITIIIH